MSNRHVDGACRTHSPRQEQRRRSPMTVSFLLFPFRGAPRPHGRKIAHSRTGKPRAASKPFAFSPHLSLSVRPYVRASGDSLAVGGAARGRAWLLSACVSRTCPIFLAPWPCAFFLFFFFFFSLSACIRDGSSSAGEGGGAMACWGSFATRAHVAATMAGGHTLYVRPARFGPARRVQAAKASAWAGEEREKKKGGDRLDARWAAGRWDPLARPIGCRATLGVPRRRWAVRRAGSASAGGLPFCPLACLPMSPPHVHCLSRTHAVHSL